MTQLLIKLQQPHAFGHLEAGAVATVRLLADAEGKVIRTSWTAQKPLNVAGGDPNAAAYTKFELPSGGYYGVEITYPRGPDTSQEYLVREGEVRQETITMEASPSETLSWQKFAGNMRRELRASEELFRDLTHFRVKENWGKLKEKWGRLTDSDINMLTGNKDELVGKVQERYGFSKDRADREVDEWTRAQTEPVTRYVAAPRVFAPVLETRKPWAQVLKAMQGRHAWQMAPWLDGMPAYDGPDYVTWFRQMPNRDQARRLRDELRRETPSEPELQFPRWLLFEVTEGRDLASVPWAWSGDEQQDDAEMQFLYDRLRPNPIDHRAGCLKISVRDRRWFGLLEFLGSGRLLRTGEMATQVVNTEDPQDALFGKRKGPLTAAAGAIILITQAKSNERQEWDPWLQNLCEWFPGIPDGAILLGYRRLQQARTRDDLSAAFDRLREGIRRGIPFFSACIRMLALGLAQIGEDIPEADQHRKQIAPVSARVDPDQAFTVIRL